MDSLKSYDESTASLLCKTSGSVYFVIICDYKLQGLSCRAELEIRPEISSSPNKHDNRIGKVYFFYEYVVIMRPSPFLTGIDTREIVAEITVP